MHGLAQTLLPVDRSGRLLLWFETPIHAGVLLAAIVLLLRTEMWMFQGRRHGKLICAISLVVEVALIYLLERTGSRGAVAAFVGVLMLQVLYDYRTEPKRRTKMSNWHAAFSFGVLVVFIVVGKFGGRYASAFSDPSIGNRFAMLESSCDLLGMAPMMGNGLGWSGFHYSQWCAPLDSKYLYTGLLNEYLQLGVEFGLPVLWGVFVVAIALGLEPWICAPSVSIARSIIRRNAHAALSVILLCMTASTIRGSLLIVGLLGTVTVLYRYAVGTWFFSGMVLLRSCALAIMVVCGIMFCGKSGSLKIVAPSRTSVLLADRDGGADQRNAPVVLMDRNVMGGLYGHSLRRMLGAAPLNGRAKVLLPEVPLVEDDLRGHRTIVSFGASLACLPADRLGECEEIYVIHPLVLPTEEYARKIRAVVLPEIDEDDLNRPWRDFCAKHNIRWAITSKRGCSLVGARDLGL